MGVVTHEASGGTAIAGLGITEMGKVYGRTATDFAVEAITLGAPPRPRRRT
jgi:hypothetical protein